MTDAPAPLSVVLPVYNEAAILEVNVGALADYLAGCDAIGPFEIILACNGCVDDSESIARRMAGRDPRIRCLSLRTRGLGLAIRAGIEAAAHERVMFYAVDLPFGLAVVAESATAMAPRRIVIGSKGHPRSAVERSAIRSLYSLVISTLNNALFGLRVKDTQGSLLFPAEILRRCGREMDSDGAFFQAQIVIYGQRLGCEVVEIPVTLRRDRDVRGTRFKLIGDGLAYLRAIARERWKLTRARGQMDEL